MTSSESSKEMEMVHDVITRARIIISNIALYTKKACAIDRRGNPIGPNEHGAVRFNVRGAILFALYTGGYEHNMRGANEVAISKFLVNAIGISGPDKDAETALSEWNKKTRHADILLELDKAIKQLQIGSP